MQPLSFEEIPMQSESPEHESSHPVMIDYYQFLQKTCSGNEISETLVFISIEFRIPVKLPISI